jgi:hypothetical protein
MARFANEQQGWAAMRGNTVLSYHPTEQEAVAAERAARGTTASSEAMAGMRVPNAPSTQVAQAAQAIDTANPTPPPTPAPAPTPRGTALAAAQANSAQRRAERAQTSVPQQGEDYLARLSELYEGGRPQIDGTWAQGQLDLLDELRQPIDRDAIADRNLRQMLSAGSLARGGAGAQAMAQRQAALQAPVVQAEAEQVALQQEEANRRLQAEILGGARGSEIQEAGLRTQYATQFQQGMQQIMGVNLQMDQQQRDRLGQMAIDAERLGLDWAALAESERAADLDRVLAYYGIDQQTRVALKQTSAQKRGQTLGFLASFVPDIKIGL